MYILTNPKLVLLATPRTASGAVASVFRQLGSGRSLPNHWAIREDHLTHLKNRGWEAVTIIRNPWDAIVSWYHNYQDAEEEGSWADHIWSKNVEPDGSFKNFVRVFMVWDGFSLPWIKPAEGMLYSYPASLADHVMRYETLNDELSALLDGYTFTLPRQIAPQSNRETDYRTYYDNETRDLVGDALADEINRFGYSF